MSQRIQGRVYYGPPSWFQKEIEGVAGEEFLDIIDEREAKSRRHRIINSESQTFEDESEDTPVHMIVNSSDYASLVEGAVSNFSGIMRSINPTNLYLNNPPELVRTHVERIADVEEFHYTFSGFTPTVLRKFYDGFRDHLVGQNSVKNELLAAIYPLTSGKANKPVVVMFYGPSGVGKTETAKFISKLTGGDLFRKQFSMLHSEKFASYVFGGSHHEPSLAFDLMERDCNVILFDEFDKASPVFHSAFYELFDEGVLEDKNYRASVGSPLIICTSNYGSESAVKKALGEALYSRFDAFIEFHSLSVNEVAVIADKIIDKKFANLDLSERTRLNIDDLRIRIKNHAKELGNIRKLSSTIDQVISFELAMSILKEEYNQ